MKTLNLLIFILGSFVSINSHANVETALEYFEAFAQRDHQKMATLYKPQQQNIFSDPIFLNLSTEEVQSMWQMLLEKTTEFKLQYQVLEANETQVRVSWTATYTYPDTGRKVINNAITKMHIENRFIVRQQDTFDLCKWAKMALPSLIAHATCLAPDMSLRPAARRQLKLYMKK